MAQLIAIFAFMLVPIWIILASATVGWIADLRQRTGGSRSLARSVNSADTKSVRSVGDC